ncbi:hypothetical protein [Mycobacterium servetii]|uniref:Transmembrane protein n=1 Tax=Mycobacterium servetii TaxID=3237418 RepID=A0ABV4CCY3_9MYCO
MLRTLIIAAVFTAIAIHLGAPLDIAAAWIFVGTFTARFTTPLIRRIIRRRRRRRPIAQRPAPTMLTQINHYHYYAPTAPPVAHTVTPGQRALPEFSEQQIAHNRIFDSQ